MDDLEPEDSYGEQEPLLNRNTGMTDQTTDNLHHHQQDGYERQGLGGERSLSKAVNAAGDDDFIGLRAHSSTFWLAAFTMLWASFCYGMLFGSLSPVLAGDCEGTGDDTPPSCPECFNCDMDLSEQRLSFWILVGPLSTVLLGPLGGAGLDRLGHRQMMTAAGLIYMAGWAALALTPGSRGLWSTKVEADLERQSWASVLFIFGGRLLSWGGFALGAGVPAIYLVETAQPQHRGLVGGSCQLAIMLGTLAEFSLGAVVSSWRLLYAINGLAFVPCLLLVTCIPPSPRWLNMNNVRKRLKLQQQLGGAGSLVTEFVAHDAAEVKHALSRFYLPELDLATLFAEIVPQQTLLGEDGAAAAHGQPGGDASDEVTDGGCCSSCRFSANQWQVLQQLRTPVIMCAFLAVSMQLCPGGTVVVLFSGPILEGFAPGRRNVVALLCNAAALPGCLLALAFADKFGRRKLLILSAVGQCIASVALGTFFLLKTREISFLQGGDLTALGKEIKLAAFPID